MTEFNKKIVETITERAKNLDLSVDDWIELSQTLNDVYIESEEDKKVISNTLKELSKANRRLKNYITSGEELRKLAEAENNVGEDKSISPVITSNSLSSSTFTVTLLNQPNHQMYKNDEFQVQCGYRVLGENANTVSVIIPKNIKASDREFTVSITNPERLRNRTLLFWCFYVSPTGVKSYRSNVLEVEGLKDGYFGFVEDVMGNIAKRFGSGTFEDSQWLPKTEPRLNEWNNEDTITKYLDQAEHLPYKELKRYVLKYNRVSNTTELDPVLNLKDITNPESEVIGFGDADSFDHPKIKMLDHNVHQIMVKVPKYHLIDVNFEWNSKKYTLKLVMNSEFQFRFSDNGFNNVTNVKGRGIVTNGSNVVTSVESDAGEFYIGAFEATNVYNRIGSFCINKAPHTNTMILETRKGVQSYGSGYKICNYYQWREIVFLYSCERGYVGNYADHLRVGKTKWNLASSISNAGKTIGKTLSLGNNSGAGISDKFNNYRGIENIAGNVFHVLDGILCISKDRGQGYPVMKAYAAHHNTDYVEWDDSNTSITEPPGEGYKLLEGWVEVPQPLRAPDHDGTNDGWYVYGTYQLMPGEWFQDTRTSPNGRTQGVGNGCPSQTNNGNRLVTTLLTGGSYSYTNYEVGVYYWWYESWGTGSARNDKGVRNTFVFPTPSSGSKDK